MTSLAQVTSLVDAHVRRDSARFRAVTLQIAAHVAGRSEQGAAQLRKLVDRTQDSVLEPLPSARGLLSLAPERVLVGAPINSARVVEGLARRSRAACMDGEA